MVGVVRPEQIMTHLSSFDITLDAVARMQSSTESVEGALAYDNLRCVHEVQDRIFWCHLDPKGRPSFTPALVQDILDMQDRIQRLARDPANPVGWVVLGSRVPGIFNLGGDLTLLASKVREADSEGLRQYAYRCVEMCFRNATGYGASVVSVGLAQGEALGGGFEALLSCDVIVAERRTRFGLPEVLMNLFPGVGANSFLTRRLGSGKALKMILSGEMFSAADMHDIGVVDVLAEDGEGEAAVRDYIARNSARHRGHAAIYKAQRRVSPVSLEELRDVADIWVEAAMTLSNQDLRRMALLVSAQDRTLRQRPARPDAARAE